MTADQDSVRAATHWAYEKLRVGVVEWTYSTLLYSYERGNLDNQLYEISEDEANRIVQRIRRTVTGEP